MLHDMPKAVRQRMRYLEKLDGRQRNQGAPDDERLKQIPPATGRFLALLAANAPEGICLELGTSAGYSTLWLAIACRITGRRLVTIEKLEAKVKLARETIHRAAIEDVVDLIHGDATKVVKTLKGIAFCFLDVDKEYYRECYEMAVANMVSGGLLVADNITSHQDILGGFVKRVMRDRRVDAIVVPIGSGLLLCRKV